MSIEAWNGAYPHCACCNTGCGLTHHASCIVPEHYGLQRGETGAPTS